MERKWTRRLVGVTLFLLCMNIVQWFIPQYAPPVPTSLHGQSLSVEQVQSWCEPKNSPACDIKNFHIPFTSDPTKASYISGEPGTIVLREGVMAMVRDPGKGVWEFYQYPAEVPGQFIELSTTDFRVTRQDSLKGAYLTLEQVQDWCEPRGSEECAIQHFSFTFDGPGKTSGTRVIYEHPDGSGGDFREIPLGVLYRSGDPCDRGVYYNTGPSGIGGSQLIEFSTVEGLMDYC